MPRETQFSHKKNFLKLPILKTSHKGLILTLGIIKTEILLLVVSLAYFCDCDLLKARSIGNFNIISWFPLL